MGRIEQRYRSFIERASGLHKNLTLRADSKGQFAVPHPKAKQVFDQIIPAFKIKANQLKWMKEKLEQDPKHPFKGAEEMEDMLFLDLMEAYLMYMAWTNYYLSQAEGIVKGKNFPRGSVTYRYIPDHCGF